MDELKTRTPCAGLLPLEIGGVTLRELDPGALTSLSPLGDAAALSAALEKAHGLDWPEPGAATEGKAARAVWFGLREVLLVGPAPDAALADHAAVVDLSDAYTCVALEGARGVDVLARLVPVDLRPAHFAQGRTARTQLGHMNASITRTGPEAVMILVFRSMAATLVHELRAAMETVAARG